MLKKLKIIAMTATVACTMLMFACEDDMKPEEIPIEDIPIKELYIDNSEVVNIPSTLSHDELPFTLNECELPNFKTKDLEKDNYDCDYNISNCIINNNHAFFLVEIIYFSTSQFNENYYYDSELSKSIIYDYDLTTFSLEQMWSIDKNTISNPQMVSFDNSLYVAYEKDLEEDKSEFNIIKIDEKTYETEHIYTDSSSKNFLEIFTANNKLLGFKSEGDYIFEENPNNFSLVEYDKQSNQWVTLAENIYSGYTPYVSDDNLCTISIEQFDDTFSYVYSTKGKYNLHTSKIKNDSKYLQFIQCTPNSVCWLDISNGLYFNNCILYRYNVDEEKLYTTELNSSSCFGGSMFGDGLITYSNSLIVYIVPELGITIPLNGFGSVHVYNVCENFLAFSYLKNENEGMTERNGTFYWAELPQQN